MTKRIPKPTTYQRYLGTAKQYAGRACAVALFVTYAGAGIVYYQHKDWIFKSGEYFVSVDHANKVNSALTQMFMEIMKLKQGAGCT